VIGAPLALPGMTKAYGGDSHGYADYLTLNEPALAIADASI
jgi:hypothetical protein